MPSQKRLLVLLITLLLPACTLGNTPQLPQPPTATPLIGRLTFAGSTTLQPLVEKLAEVYRREHPMVTLDIAAGGSVVGINAVQDGSVDIGMSSRELKDDEQRPGMEHFQIGLDVLAIVVHPSNPVRQLSFAQLQGIYTGTITNWNMVGGPDRTIRVVARAPSSGTRGAFDDIVLKPINQELVPEADIQVTAGEVEAQVARYPEAIGYVGFGNLKADVVVLAIDGVAPSPATALDNSYSLKRPLLLLSGPLSRKLSRSFIDFALSDAGQQIVLDEGWVPMKTIEGSVARR